MSLLGFALPGPADPPVRSTVSTQPSPAPPSPAPPCPSPPAGSGDVATTPWALVVAALAGAAGMFALLRFAVWWGQPGAGDWLYHEQREPRRRRGHRGHRRAGNQARPGDDDPA